MANSSKKDSKSKSFFSKINKPKFIILSSALLVCLCCVIFLSYAGAYTNVYPNTYINDIPVGGMAEEELTSVYQKFASENPLPKTLNLVLEGKTLKVETSDIDLSFDWEKTTKVMLGNRTENGFFTNIGAYMKSLFSDSIINPSVKFSNQKLDLIIEDFVAPYEIEPHDASYTAENGLLTIKKGNNGKKLDKVALSAEISKNITQDNATINLSIVPVDGKTFSVDALYKELSGNATDAYYKRSESGEIIVVADKSQIKVKKEDLKKAIDSGKDTVSISAEIIPAKKTKKELENALFSDVIGTWTSNFSVSNAPRTENIVLSASKINNSILLPGETFSYDKTVGPRTAENGFKIAGVYINNKVENGIGGGICQTSSTLYSAVLYANLEIVSRTSHSLPVSYMPPGQDATIASGAIDFLFKNNTEYPIKIVTEINGGSITCSILGTPVKGQKVEVNNTITTYYSPTTQIETDPSVPVGYKKTTKGSSGYAVSSSRTVYQDGTAVKTEPLTKSVYHASPDIITVNPADSGTPVENLLEYGAISEAPLPEDIELNGEGATSHSEKTELVDNTETIYDI